MENTEQPMDNMEIDILTNNGKEKLYKLVQTKRLTYLNLPEECFCCNCHLVAIAHFIYPCQHVYCDDCYAIYKQKNNECRVCHQKIGVEMLQSKEIKLKIYNSKVDCLNKEYGCFEEISLGRLLLHLDLCKFSKDRLLPLVYQPESEDSNRVTEDEVNELKKSNKEIKVMLNYLAKRHEEFEKQINHLEDKNRILTDVNETIISKNHKLEGYLKNASLEYKKIAKDNKEMKGEIEVLSNEFKKIEQSSKKLEGDGELQKKLIKLDRAQNSHKTEASENKQMIDKLTKELAEGNSEIGRIRKVQGEEHSSLNEKLESMTSIIEELQRDIESVNDKNVDGIYDRFIETCKSENIQVKNKLDELFECQLRNKNELHACVQLFKKMDGRLNKSNKDLFQSLNSIDAMDNRLKGIEAFIEGITGTLNAIGPIIQNKEYIGETILQIQHEKDGTLVWQVPNYKQLKETMGVIFSKPFYSSDCSFTMRLKLIFDNTGIRPHIKYSFGERGRPLYPGFYHQRTFSILDQSESADKRDITMVEEPHFGTTSHHWMTNKTGNHLVHYRILEEKTGDTYLRNDSIQVRVSVEPLWHLFINPLSCHYSMVEWTIDNYKRTKEESLKFIRRLVFSPCFNSTSKGNRVKAAIWWLNPHQFELSLCFLVGKHDDNLSSQYPHSCSFFVVNQEEEGSSKFMKLVTQELREESDTKKYHCHRSKIACELVERTPYLVDDRMVLKVLVEPLQKIPVFFTNRQTNG